MLFEIAVVLEPTEKDAKNGALEELVIEPTTLVAKDEKSAAMTILLKQAEALGKYDIGRLKVLVRPFA
jgi:hypothetical protein